MTVGRAAPLQSFLTGAPRDNCEFRLLDVTRSYNTVRVQVATTAPELLFVRNAYSPYWKATVGGVETPVYRAYRGFMAIVVPAGNSDVRLHFAPPFVLAALLGSYGILLAAALLVWRWPSRPSTADPSSG